MGTGLRFHVQPHVQTFSVGDDLPYGCGTRIEIDQEVYMRIGKYESSDGTTGTAVTFLLIGLGVGAALGLLLAPKTGRQLRKDLRRSYDDALETASDWTDEAKERLDDVVEKGGDFADELRSKAKPLSDLLRRS